MKFFAVLAAAAVAVASAADCDVTKLAPVAVTGANAVACQKATTYSAATATIPTGDVLKNVCSTKACNDLLDDMKAVVTESCTYLGKDIKTEVIDKFPAACAAALGGSAAGANSTSSNSTTTAPAATTAAPAATTVAPAASASSSAGSSAGSSASGSVTSAPTSTTAVPTPSPTSGAASLTIAAGAVVATAVASLL